MSVLLSHATGNENVRQVLAALQSEALLEVFVTSLGFPNPKNDWLIPRSLKRVRKKRTYTMVEAEQFVCHPLPEVIRNVALRSKIPLLKRTARPDGPWGIDWVSRSVGRKAADFISGRPVGLVYSYPNQSVDLFRRARDLGISRVLEVPHAHWRLTVAEIMSEAERSPEWAFTLPEVGRFSEKGGEADEEIQLADLIFSPSRQVTRSLSTVLSADRIVEIPYGCPEVSNGTRPLSWSGTGPLKVLFVGRVTALKGIADIAGAVEGLGDQVEFTIAGELPAESNASLHKLLRRVNYVGRLTREEVAREMRSNHLFALPSRVEGRSLAALEAQSVGLPCIVTPGSGVDDLVEKGGGTIIGVGGSHLTEALSKVLDSPERIEEWSVRALENAKRASWDDFRDRIIRSICALIR